MDNETTTTGAPKELSLDQLTKWLRGQEASLGPIIAIGHNGAATAATFQFDLFEPKQPATIFLKAGGPAPPGDWLKQCEGSVFVQGEIKEVVVYRQPG
jgi:hypothetical protein